MTYLLRHVLSVAALPVTMAVLVPAWIARRYDVHLQRPGSIPQTILVALGAILLVLGLIFFFWSQQNFYSHGQGTLAPWDATRRLVVSGPYRYVRNPMITGVLLVLAGTAAVLRSVPHGIWAGLFLTANAIYIPAVEEPLLARRFGPDYELYRRNVPRLLPGRRPWGQISIFDSSRQNRKLRSDPDPQERRK